MTLPPRQAAVCKCQHLSDLCCELGINEDISDISVMLPSDNTSSTPYNAYEAGSTEDTAVRSYAETFRQLQTFVNSCMNDTISKINKHFSELLASSHQAQDKKKHDQPVSHRHELHSNSKFLRYNYMDTSAPSYQESSLMYIVAVLSIYSIIIVLVMIKYMRVEQHQMNEMREVQKYTEYLENRRNLTQNRSKMNNEKKTGKYQTSGDVRRTSMALLLPVASRIVLTDLQSQNLLRNSSSTSLYRDVNLPPKIIEDENEEEEANEYDKERSEDAKQENMATCSSKKNVITTIVNVEKQSSDN